MPGDKLITVLNYANGKGKFRALLATRREWPNDLRAGHTRECIDRHVDYDRDTFAALGLKYDDWTQVSIEAIAS